jgi:hypothetical protein
MAAISWRTVTCVSRKDAFVCSALARLTSQNAANPCPEPRHGLIVSAKSCPETHSPFYIVFLLPEV